MYRKDFTQLSSAELDNLAIAFNALSDDGVITEYRNFHRVNGSSIHWGPVFLPWHRYFLRKFEQALQAALQTALDNVQESDDVTAGPHPDIPLMLPYWDWTRKDSQNLDDSTDDIAGKWESFFGGRGGTGRLNWPVSRRNNPPSSTPLPSLRGSTANRAINVIEELNKTSYYQFRNMESSSHVRGHAWVGGDMGDPRESPNDPLFYLHHCNIDRLWAIWQQNNPNVDQYSTTVGHPRDSELDAVSVALDSSMVGLDTDAPTPKSMLDHTALGYRYSRDMLLEIAWDEDSSTQGSLITGDSYDADVFIRDSASDTGDYPSAETHWTSPDIWVRRSMVKKGQTNNAASHERPIVGVENYMYVNVTNRGGARASGIRVKAYHCKPGTAMTWPNDFEYTGVWSLDDMDPGSSAIAGPFPWTPEIKDHECLFAFVDSSNDPSMVPMVYGRISHSKLVRFDNNVGQRNVFPIEVAINGKRSSGMRVRGSPSRSNNALRFNDQALPGGASLRLKVPNGILKSAKLIALRKTEVNKRFTTLQKMRSSSEPAIEGIQLAAHESRNIQLEVGLSASAEQGHTYPLIATQVQDGEIIGQLTMELLAIEDDGNYVFGNKNSKELHTVACPFWSKMMPENRVPFSSVRAALAHGYNGCRFCLSAYDTDRAD